MTGIQSGRRRSSSEIARLRVQVQGFREQLRPEVHVIRAHRAGRPEMHIIGVEDVGTVLRGAHPDIENDLDEGRRGESDVFGYRGRLVALLRETIA